MKVDHTTILALGLFVLLLGVSSWTWAASTPTAPTLLSPGWTSTFNESNYDPQSVDAIAGNITFLVITALGQTKAWQGYYGNITGTITLDDVNNYTFYNWTTTEPQGQIYATLNTSIGWTGVECFNFTDDSTANWSSMESYYGIQTDDVDGINETFNDTSHPSFQVGSNTLTGCPTTYIYRDDAAQYNDFVNVLLYDPAINETGWIYTTIIENKTVGPSGADKTCYNGELCDFQILVNDDGHGTNTATTTYYFWVELL